MSAEALPRVHAYVAMLLATQPELGDGAMLQRKCDKCAGEPLTAATVREAAAAAAATGATAGAAGEWGARELFVSLMYTAAGTRVEMTAAEVEWLEG